MSRIDDIFRSLREQGRRALVPFVSGGFPTAGATARAIEAIDASGASVIEVGIPFSDPIADGPVIAGAMHRALGAGATPETVFEEVRSVRARVGAGLVAMVSVSIVHRAGGPLGFVARAVDSGFDGFIFPDVPLEEAGPLLEAAKAKGASASLLIAPTTPPDRASLIAKASTGFVYLLALSGVTGERQSVPDLGPRVRQLRQSTALPVAVGFGVSTADHVRQITREADAAIVGSALVRRMTEAADAAQDPAAAAGSFCRQLMMGLDASSTAATTGERQSA